MAELYFDDQTFDFLPKKIGFEHIILICVS